MTSSPTRVQDWVRFYKASGLNYQMNALLSCLENDGEEMLRQVLKALKLEKSVDLVKDALESGNHIPK